MILFLVLTGYVAASHVGKVPPAIPLLRDDFNIGLVYSGWIVSAFSVVSAGFGLFFGATVDRLNYRNVAMAGLVLIGSLSLIGAAARSPEVLLVTRLGEGVGFVLCVVSIPPLIVRACRSRDQSKAFGLWGTYMPGGFSAMVIISPIFLAENGWNGSWRINGGISLAWAMLFFALVPSAPPSNSTANTAKNGSVWRDLKTVLTSPGPLLMATSFVGYSGMFLAVTAFLPVMLVTQNGLPLATASLLTGIVIAANIAGNVASGWVLAWGVPRPILLIVTIVIMFFCTLMIYQPDLSMPWRIAMAVIFTGVGGLIPGALLSGAANYAPSPALVASSVGLMSQGAGIGLISGPPLLALVVGTAGTWSAAPIYTGAAACLTIVSAVGMMVVRARRQARNRRLQRSI